MKDKYKIDPDITKAETLPSWVDTGSPHLVIEKENIFKILAVGRG